MFTKSDFADYCSQIIALEKKMEGKYRGLIPQLTNEDCRRIFEKLANEEVVHARTAAELRDIFTADD